MKNQPNFFVIGAQKAGTTTVCSYLQKHNEVFISTPKEPAFFCESLNWTKGLDWYESLFSEADRFRIRGEGSTFYSQRPEHEGVVSKIHNLSPDAKFLYMVRDPFERLYSHYWHLVRHHIERKDIFEAVKTDPQYLMNGHYAYQLEPYINVFGIEQIKVVSYEAFFQQKRETLNDIFEWLNLSPLGAETDVSGHLNKGAVEMEQVRGSGWLFKFSRSSFWRAIGPRIPQKIKDVGRSYATKPIKRNDEEREALRDYCLPLMRPQVAEFESLMGKNFVEWQNFN